MGENEERKGTSKYKQPRFTQYVPELKDDEKSPYFLDVKPILKWAGGKRSLLDKYKPYFPKTFHKYYEPFFGGGAIFFYLFGNGEIKAAKISDINSDLINVYIVVRDKLDELFDELKTGKYINEKEVFYNIRAEEPQDPVLRAARMIYLNRTCYNGLYRVNKQGKFNVPFGKYPKNVKIFDEENMKNVSQCLQKVEVILEDFEESVKPAKKGDFIYFDPPYIPLTDTAYFTDYTSEGFGIKEQERLAKVFKDLDEKGCYVMESNSGASLVEELYEGFTIEKIHAKRYISCDPEGRGEVKESLIMNYKL